MREKLVRVRTVHQVERQSSSSYAISISISDSPLFNELGPGTEKFAPSMSAGIGYVPCGTYGAYSA